MEVLRVPPSPALRQWSQRRGFSAELVARWGVFYPDLESLIEALERPAAAFLRLNGLRGDPRDTHRRLTSKGFILEESGLPETFQIVEQPFSAGATEEYLLGRYYLQDASSTLAPLALEPKPGEAIADLCAAPGGKTIQMADMTENRAAVFAFESDAGRARALESNLNRCGVTSVALHSTRAQEATKLGLRFDRVLLDAPCTGEGVIPRDPTRKTGHLGEYAVCAEEQTDLLRTAHAILKPDGVLVYSTCTLAPEENEFQVDWAIRELGFEPEPLPKRLQNLRMRGKPLLPGLTRVLDRRLDERLHDSAHALPHLHGCLGFYLARLRRRED